ncbi:MAG: hypothetical protein COA88_07180 [Kordia sp.]|nr:MAG: hypothetical protein COA88_07180 [Kordia sp.]
MKKQILGLIALCSTFIISAQDFKTEFNTYLAAKKVEKNHQVNINYNLYKGIKGTKSYESYSGVQAKLGSVIYQKVATTEYILGKDFVVKLNHDEKAMMVGYSSKSLQTDITQLDVESLRPYFKETLVVDHGNYLSFDLSFGNVQNIPVSKVILEVSKKDYSLKKQIVYYNMLSDFSVYDTEKKDKRKAELNMARLEISYTGYKNKIDLDKSVFVKETYFIYQNNTIETAKQFKDFELFFAK